MKLVLIRHGESAWNLENRFTGWKDVDLSPKGVEEAKSATPIYNYNRYATQALSLMGKPNIQFLTNLYAAYIPSLLDLIQKQR